MKIIGLDNKEYSWRFTKYNRQREDCSLLHLRARKILYDLFPFDIIYEEVVLPGIYTEINIKSLIADFYIHRPRLMIEVQGEQHYNFNRFFYGNKLEYFRARKLDTLKKKWCQINNITLIELPYNETDEQWRKKICQKEN